MTEKKKTIADIAWEQMEIDGKMESVCSVADARVYLNVSEPGLMKILNRNNVTRYERSFGLKKFVKKSDLDELLKGRPATNK
jgi:hypothetical protein